MDEVKSKLNIGKIKSMASVIDSVGHCERELKHLLHLVNINSFLLFYPFIFVYVCMYFIVYVYVCIVVYVYVYILGVLYFKLR